jgi:predicted RNA-binding protein with EMAP domain
VMENDWDFIAFLTQKLEPLKTDSVLSAITDVSAIAGSTYSVQDHQTYHDLFVTSVGNETVGERPHR